MRQVPRPGMYGRSQNSSCSGGSSEATKECHCFMTSRMQVLGLLRWLASSLLKSGWALRLLGVILTELVQSADRRPLHLTPHPAVCLHPGHALWIRPDGGARLNTVSGCGSVHAHLQFRHGIHGRRMRKSLLGEPSQIFCISRSSIA